LPSAKTFFFFAMEQTIV